MIAYQNCIRINPNKDAAYFNMANNLKRMKQFEDAIIIYQKCTTINPNHEDAYLNMGVCLDELGRYNEAV